MMRHFYTNCFWLLGAILICLNPTKLWAITEIHVGKAGTLSSLLTATGIEAVSEESEYSEYSENSEFSDNCFDLMGRKVTNLKPGTIYIRGGKKFMLGK